MFLALGNARRAGYFLGISYGSSESSSVSSSELCWVFIWYCLNVSSSAVLIVNLMGLSSLRGLALAGLTVFNGTFRENIAYTFLAISSSDSSFGALSLPLANRLCSRCYYLVISPLSLAELQNSTRGLLRLDFGYFGLTLLLFIGFLF